jgi:hypothetical protein
VLAKVRAVRHEDLEIVLRAMGLSEQAVSGAVERLREIQVHGTITGGAWHGVIAAGTVIRARRAR